jgi:hypothetical protein
MSLISSISLVQLAGLYSIEFQTNAVPVLRNSVAED